MRQFSWFIVNNYNAVNSATKARSLGYLKSLSDASESHKHQLTCPFELTSGSFLIGK